MSPRSDEDFEKRRGHYLGTEIDARWWHRYTQDGLFARGLGEYWIGDDALYFRRYLTRTPIRIPLGAIAEVQIGRWHSGRWAAGAPVVKLIWNKAGARLSSGFVFARDPKVTETVVARLRHARSAGGG